MIDSNIIIHDLKTIRGTYIVCTCYAPKSLQFSSSFAGYLLDEAPTQIFLDYRQTTSHILSIECPLSHPFLSTTWYQNGTKLSNSSDHSLNRSSLDPDALLGVYQCELVASDPFTTIEGIQFVTVTRAMPLGRSFSISCTIA